MDGRTVTIVIVLVGYTVGYGETNRDKCYNGLGSHTEKKESVPSGGYYSYGKIIGTDSVVYNGWFGMGGCYRKDWSTAGSGGVAGQGGIIEYSSTSEIYSYNGNRITKDDFDYGETYYEYDKDGNYLDGTNGNNEDIAEVVELKNEPNKKIIPAKIFIQDGFKRKVYDKLQYMSNERKEKFGINEANIEERNIATYGTTTIIEIISEDNNVTHSQQGIGSGAGYIELSNGTFEVMAETP